MEADLSSKLTFRKLTLVSTLGWFLASSVPVCAQDAPQPSVADAARAARKDKDKDKAKDKDAAAPENRHHRRKSFCRRWYCSRVRFLEIGRCYSQRRRSLRPVEFPRSRLGPPTSHRSLPGSAGTFGTDGTRADRLERKHRRLPEPRRLGRKALFREGNLHPAFATTDRSDETGPRRHGSLAVQRPRQNCGQRSASAGVNAQVATNYATRGAHRIRIPVGHHRRPKPGAAGPAPLTRFGIRRTTARASRMDAQPGVFR